MLAEAEERIRSYIQQSDTPFLGLLGEAFTPAMRQAIEIATLSNPTVQGYIGYLARYPALFSVNLTAHIMEGMGQTGHFDIYPHIERAIGTDFEISQAERDKLWQAFRKAILTLGFEPSPRTTGKRYRVYEYLRQAGVPLAFADDLAEKMLVFAKRVGLPDGDDVEAIKSWQQALDAKLDLPFSVTARKAISLDDGGYYTRVFLHVYESLGLGETASGKNALEKAMAKAFQKQSSTNGRFRRAVLPSIVLNDGVVGVFMPAGDEREFEIRVDGEIHRYRSGLEDKFVALPNPLVREVTIKELASGQVSRYQLWDDSKPNRILVFSDTGRLRASGQLNQPEPLLLPPGNYTVLSRFSPTDIDVEELWDDPALFFFSLQVHPGNEFVLANGPAHLTIEGETQPYAIWAGKSRASKEGVEFHFDKLMLKVEFPKEWAAFSGRNFSLRLTATGRSEEIKLPFTLDDSGVASIDVLEAVTSAGWEAGLMRLVADVTRSGETRSLLRASVFYWYGLDEIRSGLRFTCSAMPSNLVRQLNENVEVKDNILRPRDSLSRTLRMVFKLDEHRHQTLSWNVPGIFIEIESTSEGGGTVRLNKQPGGVEVVSLTSNKQILVSASEPATLRLGQWSQRVDFSRTPTKRLPAAFLCSRLNPGGNSLTLQSDGSSVEVELLRLVHPHFVQKMTPKLWQGQFVVKFDVPKELEAVQVNVMDVISGQDVEITLEGNTGAWEHHRFGRAQLMSLAADAGGHSAYVNFDMDIWPAGAWVFKFDGRIGGVWGHLENARQDIFAAGLVYDGDGREIRISQLIGCLDGLTDRESLSVLTRAQESLLPCYAPESWQSVHWLLDIWRALVARWKANPRGAVTTLVDLAVARPPEDASSTWMLQQTIGATIPEVFALLAKDYRQVNQRPYPLVAALRAIADLKYQYPNVFPDLIHPAAASAFSNFAAIMRGDTPNGFYLEQYCIALKQTSHPIEDAFKLENDNFQPGDGDWLGPVHYKFAMRSLESNYERTLGGNEVRGQALNMCKFIKQQVPLFNGDTNPRLQGKQPHFNPWAVADDGLLDDSIAQRNENLALFGHGISLMAYHCRLASRSPEKLQPFINKLNASGMPVENCLSYLLQTGEALFGFYLLFWEFVIRAEKIK